MGATRRSATKATEPENGRDDVLLAYDVAPPDAVEISDIFPYLKGETTDALAAIKVVCGTKGRRPVYAGDFGLLSAFNCAGSSVLRYNAASAEARPFSQLLRDALLTAEPASEPAFIFDPTVYPAAKDIVFVVSAAEFPDEQAWVAFCEANMRADTALATLNQLSSQFLDSMRGTPSPCAVSSDPISSSSTMEANSAEHHALLRSRGDALAACLHSLYTPNTGLLLACPLSAAEQDVLRGLCDAVARAAQLAGKPGAALDAMSEQMHERLDELRQLLVSFQSQQTHRWLERRAQVCARPLRLDSCPHGSARRRHHTATPPASNPRTHTPRLVHALQIAARGPYATWPLCHVGPMPPHTPLHALTARAARGLPASLVRECVGRSACPRVLSGGPRSLRRSG